LYWPIKPRPSLINRKSLTTTLLVVRFLFL
jgi:hypothetical protein